MLDDVLVAVRSVADGWKAEVSRRRRVSKTDPVADTLDYCASELAAQVEQLEQDTEYLTPEQYAATFPRARRPSAQTVRNWCRTGRVKAIRGERGEYHIPRAAKPEPRRHAKKGRAA